MDKDSTVLEYVVCFYDGKSHRCFDETRYVKDRFKKAYEYHKKYNKDYKNGYDYTKLYAYTESVGLVLLDDSK